MPRPPNQPYLVVAKATQRTPDVGADAVGLAIRSLGQGLQSRPGVGVAVDNSAVGFGKTYCKPIKGAEQGAAFIFK
jgi:hypothetical protein